MSEHLKQARDYLNQAMQPTEGRLPSLVMLCQMLLLHLEAQQKTPASAEQPAPTESATREENSAAVVHLALVSMETGAITPRIELLQRLLGALSPAERTLAAQESWLADPLVAFASRALMLARDAELLTSTSQKQATSPSAATPSDAATSPSGSSEGKPWFGRFVSHEQARAAQIRLVDAAFDNKDRPRPRFSIPVQADDDDMILTDYITQQSLLSSASSPEPAQGGSEGCGQDTHRVEEQR